MVKGLISDYLSTGIQLNEETGKLYIDLAVPRCIEVIGVNSLTGREKIYILKVTEKGICLV